MRLLLGLAALLLVGCESATTGSQVRTEPVEARLPSGERLGLQNAGS